MLRFFARLCSRRQQQPCNNKQYIAIHMLFPSTYSPRSLGYSAAHPSWCNTASLLRQQHCAYQTSSSHQSRAAASSGGRNGAPDQQPQPNPSSSAPAWPAPAAPPSSARTPPPPPPPPPPQKTTRRSATPPQTKAAILARMIRGMSLPIPTKGGRAASGQYSGLICPACNGGSHEEPSFAVKVDVEQGTVAYLCHRATCGNTGVLRVPGHVSPTSAMTNGTPSSRPPPEDVAPMADPSTAWSKQAPPVYVEPSSERFKDLNASMVKWFKNRGISNLTLKRNRVQYEVETHKDNKKQAWIAFPYYKHGKVVNVKYRTTDKRFRQVPKAEKVLYGYDDVLHAADIIIVEGEMDKLSLEEAGYLNVVSVPDGAPAKVKEGDVPPPEHDTKFSYLWACREVLDPAARIIIATDNDAPGHALGEELARRLGRERCWRVRWPGRPHTPHPNTHTPSEHDTAVHNAALHDAGAAGVDHGVDHGVDQDVDHGQHAADGVDHVEEDAWYRKDANEVLVKDGVEVLKQLIENAEPYPIRGLFRFNDFYEDVRNYYNLDFARNEVFSSGWPPLDEYYRVVPGELTIVTGVPNSGKSEWIDALLVNMAYHHGWAFAVCSMEKKVRDHARQLLEKTIRKPFFDAPYATNIPRMQWEEVERGLRWISNRFFVIRYEDDELPSIKWVLDRAAKAVFRHGIRGLVIDPYNELDHQRPSSQTETEYVSKMLSEVKRFAQKYDVHVWFVAHPKQLQSWKGDPPNLYDISGSAHFINKCDNGIVVHRVRDEQSELGLNAVQVLVRKVRNKAAGQIGDTVFDYDRVTGQYWARDPENQYLVPQWDQSQLSYYRSGFKALSNPVQAAMGGAPAQQAASQQEMQAAAAAVKATAHAGEVEWEDVQQVQVGIASVGEPGVTTYVQGELLVDGELPSTQ